MHSPSHQFAEQVWQRTLPALDRRRVARRAVRAGAGAGLLVLALLTLILWRTDQPARYQWVTNPSAPSSTLAPPASLAVLVIDQSGARFREVGPEEITGEGLAFELSLEPVITSPVSEIY